MQLSVIILNYNVSPFLELCLLSVKAAIQNINAEIIVVDNNSSDDSCEMVKLRFSEVHLIENKENLGFSKGNNLGCKLAKGAYICILNPDTVVPEDCFEKLIEFSKTISNIGAIGCRLIDGRGEFLPESKRHLPTPAVALKKILGYSKSYYASELNDKDTGKVSILVGAFMFMKQDVFKAAHGFDEDYFMYGEDIDLSYKIMQLGYQNYYFGESSVIHFKGESTLKDATYARRFYAAMQIFYKKHFRANLVFDSAVWFGTHLVPLLKFAGAKPHFNSTNYVLISSKDYPSLSVKLPKAVVVKNTLEGYQEGSCYILDNNELSFKAIIQTLSKRPKNSEVTFRILPKKSTFILGSDSSNYRGDVVYL